LRKLRSTLHGLAVVLFILALPVRAAPVLPAINANNIIVITNAPFNAAGDGVGGTNNISSGGGFSNGTYTLMTCTGALTGALPILGATPPGNICALATNNSRQLNFVVTPSSLVPTGLNFQMSGDLLQLSWPPDHLGWMLQMQTNNLGTNWVDWPASTNVLQTNVIIIPSNGSVFFRLIYP